MHYSRIRRNDSLDLQIRKRKVTSREEIICRLVFNLSINHMTGCWLWKGYKNDKGYGIIKIGEKNNRVHRVSAMLFLDFDISSNLEVCHRCDNPVCWNPSHLFIAEHSDNMKDMAEKGRSMMGEKQRQSILREEIIPIIRKLRSVNMSHTLIGYIFGVDQNTIQSVVSGRTWKHIQG